MSKTYIVDGNSLLFRSYYSTAYTGNIMTNDNGIPVNAIFAFHNLIKKIKTPLKQGDHLFVAFDTGKPTKRKQEFEEYKAQRSPAPEELVAQMPIARELLEAMSIDWAELEGYEGDDLAGSMAKTAAEKGDEVTLFTSDKDFLQLLDLSDKVHVCFLKKGLTETIDYTKNNLKELFGLNPDQIADFKGIAGDPSDNYAGIKGVGEKTAMKLLNDYGHLEDVLRHCKEDMKPKVNQKIVAGEKDALFFKELATIITDMDMKEEYEKSKYRPYEKQTLAAFYRKYQLMQFLNKIDRMPGIIDKSASTQLSLFDEVPSDNEVEEDKKEIVQKVKYINAFADIKEPISGIAFDTDNENENIAALLGFAFISEKGTYYLTLESAKNDTDFFSYLESDTEKATYDLKSMCVLLHRFGFPKIKNVTFDLLLATYLYNPDSGQKMKDLFFSYGLELNPNENTAVQVIRYTIQLKDRLLKSLEEHGESKLFAEVELPLSRVLASMEIEGFPMDKEVLAQIDREYTDKLNSLERQIHDLAGEDFNIKSTKQCDYILFTKLGIERFRGEKGTGIEVLRSHYNDHPIIPLIIEHRLYSKLVSAYTSSLPDHVQEDGKIHAIYNQALTSTGRLSMSEPNLQNISIRNEEGKAIRHAFFYPGKEYYLLSLDYSQIELRMLAHVGNIKVLKEIFLEGKDIHTATASRVFNVPFEDVTSEMRRRAKAVNFGIVYGISPYGLSQQLDIPVNEAGELIKQFKATFEGIDEYQKSCIDMAKNHGYVSTILNRRRYLKDINSSNRVLRSFSERAAVNATIQGSAADLIKVAMIQCQNALEGYETKIVLQIHDELIFKVPKNELSKVEPLLTNIMEHAIELSVPLLAEGKEALTWYEAH